MGRNEGESRPVKHQQRQKRGRNKASAFKSQVITFSCIFCNDTFESTNLLFDHMRRKHPNLCEIPQITAESELVEEITAKGVDNHHSVERRITERPAPVTNVVQDKYLSEDEEEASVGHFEMVESEEGEEGEGEGAPKEDSVGELEEEIESPRTQCYQQ